MKSTLTRERKGSVRHTRGKKIALVLCLLLIVGAVTALTHDGIRLYFLVKNSEQLIKAAVPFNRTDPNATMKILVLGDSTAVGTGAAHPEDSTAGRLAASYPKAAVVNLAVNGLRIEGLLTLLKTVDATTHYDLVLIQIGANDIIRLTSMPDIATGIDKVLARAELFHGQIILLHSGAVGEAPIFPWYFRSWLSRRSLAVRELYKKAAPAHGAEYVDLIDSPVAELLRKDPEKYYANDGLHLTDAGYGLWFEEIKKHLAPPPLMSRASGP